MLRYALPALALLSSAHADEINDPKKLFSLLCVETGSTGFNWVDGNWQQTNFNLQNYVLRKVESTNAFLCERATGEIHPSQRKEFGHAQGCYVFAEVGDTALPDACTENWYLGDGSKNANLVSVVCDGFMDVSVRLSGVFVVTRTYSYSDTDVRYRDSLALSVGKCSFVN